MTEGSPPQGLSGIDIAVLAGGLGTRLRGVLDDRPKVLAPINGRPFLDYLIDWLAGFGARRLILCLGHLSGTVTTHLAGRPAGPVEIVPVIEPAPLGTAGALRFARPHLRSNPVLVLNGDTFFDVDLGLFADRHRATAPLASLLCAEIDDVSRYGRLELDEAGYVARFIEKDPGRGDPGLINAGIYLFSAALLDRIMAVDGPSLERDILQTLGPGQIRADVRRGTFIDIGTPQSLATASEIFPPEPKSPP